MQIISVAQALLILIDAAKDEPARCYALKKLYLEGGIDDKNLADIRDALKSPLLKNYEVSENFDVINNDPSRRYFETHLCFETMLTGLADLDIEELRALQAFYFENMIELSKEQKADVRAVLAGNVKPDASNESHEFSDFIRRMDAKILLLQNYKEEHAKLSYKRDGSDDPKEKQKHANAVRDLELRYQREIPDRLTVQSCEKLKLLGGLAHLGVLLGKSNAFIPLNMYGKGMFDPRARAKRVKGLEEQGTTQTQNYGIIKGNMPIPQDDLAFTDQPFQYPKPSDRSHYSSDAAWTKHSFSLLTHPYSNAISGTLMNQLRCFYFHHQVNKQLAVNDPKAYFRALITTICFDSGGHTLYEFVAPFAIDEFQKAYESIGVDLRTFTLSGLFYDNNQEAFERALQSTLNYHRQVLQRDALNHAILNLSVDEPMQQMFQYRLRNTEREQMHKRLQLIVPVKEIYEQIHVGRVQSVLNKVMGDKQKDQAYLQSMQSAYNDFLRDFEGKTPDYELWKHADTLSTMLKRISKGEALLDAHPSRRIIDTSKYLLDLLDEFSLKLKPNRSPVQRKM